MEAALNAKESVKIVQTAIKLHVCRMYAGKTQSTSYINL